MKPQNVAELKVVLRTTWENLLKQRALWPELFITTNNKPGDNWQIRLRTTWKLAGQAAYRVDPEADNIIFLRERSQVK